MAEKRLDGMRVAILATDYFEESELEEPRRALSEEGADTKIISIKPGQITAFQHDKKGAPYRVDLTLDQAKTEDFDAVLLPGGALNADRLRMEEKARDFVRKMDEMRKPIAVICHGGWLLVSAGLVQGRSLTSYYTIQDDIRNAGGKWQDVELLRDGNWVSSRSPKDLAAFNRGMIELFSEYHAPANV